MTYKKLCKCGCGMVIETKSHSEGKVYLNAAHRLQHKVLNPETRVGKYHNARRDSSPLLTPIKELLTELNYPKFIVRNNFSSDLMERGVTGYGQKDIRYHVAILLPTLGYRRRTKLSYERIPDAISN